MSKRDRLREKRRLERRRRRSIMMVMAAGSALIIAALLIWPSVKPIGDIVVPKLAPRPNADGRAMGNPEAPVTIEAFEDFQCPVCARFSEQVEPSIVEAYVATGKAYFIFRHYPFLDDQVPGKESDHSASASMCAAEQGLFWEYHDLVFANWEGENQGAFSDRRLMAFAEKLDIDMQAFEECFREQRYMPEVAKDLALGKQLGVSGTPSVFVNGNNVAPGFAPSYAQISDAVEEILSAGD